MSSIGTSSVCKNNKPVTQLPAVRRVWVITLDIPQLITSILSTAKSLRNTASNTSYYKETAYGFQITCQYALLRDSCVVEINILVLVLLTAMVSELFVISRRERDRFLPFYPHAFYS